MNKFGDWSSDEYNSLMKGLNLGAVLHPVFDLLGLEPAADQSDLLGAAPAQSDLSATPPATAAVQAPGVLEASQLPATVNWTQAGAVTSVKSQQNCACCWAFASAGAVEGAVAIKYGLGNPVSLSAQNLADCVTGCNGCNGGKMVPAYNYMKSNGGIDTEAAYPWADQSFGWCRYTPSGAASNAIVTDYVQVPVGSESALQAAVALTPVSVGIDASHRSFQFYASGVYNEPLCSSTLLDHAVLVVGYGVDESGADYWLVKNQWGVGWGINGYIKMTKGVNNQCGIATLASYPIIQ